MPNLEKNTKSVEKKQTLLMGNYQEADTFVPKPTTPPNAQKTNEPQGVVAPKTELAQAPKSHQIGNTTSGPAQSNGATVFEPSETERVLQMAEAKLREKLANAKPACADEKSLSVEAISNAHGSCTGFFGEDSILPEFLKYGNKLYVLHCKDGAVAYVCGVCRVCFTTLHSFERHAKEVHGWTFEAVR